MTTRLTDVIVPEDYRQYMAIDSPEVTRIFESGIAVQNPLLDQAANSGGNIVQIPFWKDLDATAEPNIGNDDPTDKSSPQKLESGKQIALVDYLNQSWSAMDLVAELAGSDPVDRIQARANAYWSRQWQRRIVGASVGVMEDNIANDDGDMVHSVATDEAGDPVDAELFGKESVIRTEKTFGDAIGEVGAIAMHSVVYHRARELDLIEYFRPSEGAPAIERFQGKVVIVDDNVPVEQGVERLIYTSVLFGRGAFGFGRGNPKVPVETEREGSAGKGSGQETLFERHTWLLHPFGYQADAQQVAGQSATLAELKNAALWDRVVDRKNVPLAFLRTNG